MMPNFFWNLPFQIGIASIGICILVWASIFLIHDLHEMQREQQAGSASFWYRRSKVRISLKGIGYALLVFLFDFGSSAINFLPRNTAIISMISMIFVAMSIVVVIASSRLLRALRNLQWESREDFSLTWHHQPKILKRIGQILFLCGPLLDIAYLEYSLLAQDILHQPLSENIAPLIIIAGVFFLFAVAFYFYAILLEVLKSRSY
jgi:hypothetical protein